MGSLNLNNAADFAKLTLSTASNALLQLAGLSTEEWDIQESAYGHPQNDADPLVLFHVFKSSVPFNAAVSQVTDNAGRRKVPFVFPYTDGQTTDDLGRKAEAFEFDVLFHGPNYLDAYLNFLNELQDPRPGSLVHPVRGRVRVVAHEWTTTHQSQSRQAAIMKVSFWEHNFDVTFARDTEQNKSNIKSALSNALSFVGKIAAVVTQVEGAIAIAQSARAFIAAAITAYNDLFQSNLQGLNQAFNEDSPDALPGLLPANDGVDSFPIVSTGDPFTQVNQTLLNPSTTATLQAQQAIDQIKFLRQQLSASIALFQSVPDGELVFYDAILDLKKSGIAIQEALEVGLQSSRSRIINYKVPRVMSLREVAFLNGLLPDRAVELELLNPSLLSTNHIEKDTAIKVPLE